MKELWKPVVGWEGLYEVSNHGRVRSMQRTVLSKSRWGTTRSMTFPQRILKQTPCAKVRSPTGYLRVTLTDQERGCVTTMVHTIVLEAFKGPRPQGYQGAHNNDKQLDNRSSNLAWKTRKDNAADALVNGSRVHGADGRFEKVYIR